VGLQGPTDSGWMGRPPLDPFVHYPRSRDGTWRQRARVREQCFRTCCKLFYRVLYEAVADIQAAERNIEICKSLIDLAQINRVNFGLPARPIKIAFDEWNVWDELKGHAENGLAQVYDYSDMLGFVAWLNVLVRKHDDLGLACLAQSVNVVSLGLMPMRNQADPSDLTIDDKSKWYPETDYLPSVSSYSKHSGNIDT